MTDIAESATPRPVGLRDIPLVFVCPRRVFARVEDVAVYGWPLVMLLTFVTLIGFATVQTGLIDREVDRGVQERIERIDSEKRDVVERSQLRELYATEYKAAMFQKLLARVQVIVIEPISALVYVLLISAFIYGIVALTGRKPEWNTLMTICVLAGFVDALRLLMKLVLMLRYGSLEVDTSLSLMAANLKGVEGIEPEALGAIAGLLTAADPFRMWYWLVLILGLTVTAQLRSWKAWVVGTLCWLLGGGVRAGLSAAALSAAANAGGAGG